MQSFDVSKIIGGIKGWSIKKPYHMKRKADREKP